MHQFSLTHCSYSGFCVRYKHTHWRLQLELMGFEPVVTHCRDLICCFNEESTL
jgi:hypothetical protein